MINSTKAAFVAETNGAKSRKFYRLTLPVLIAKIAYQLKAGQE